jgi:hypothetical protein
MEKYLHRAGSMESHAPPVFEKKMMIENSPDQIIVMDVSVFSWYVNELHYSTYTS